MKSTSSDDELVLMFLNKKLKILGSSSPDAGRNSWFDAGLEALSRPLSYIFEEAEKYFQIDPRCD